MGAALRPVAAEQHDQVVQPEPTRQTAATIGHRAGGGTAAPQEVQRVVGAYRQPLRVAEQAAGRAGREPGAGIFGAQQPRGRPAARAAQQEPVVAVGVERAAGHAPQLVVLGTQFPSRERLRVRSARYPER